MTTARGATSLRDHGAGGDEGLLADLDARDEHGAAADAARPPQHGAAQGLPRRVAGHRVVVRRHRAGADEDVVLDDALRR